MRGQFSGVARSGLYSSKWLSAISRPCWQIISMLLKDFLSYRSASSRKEAYYHEFSL